MKSWTVMRTINMVGHLDQRGRAAGGQQNGGREGHEEGSRVRN